jgi:hypothetical protein
MVRMSVCIEITMSVNSLTLFPKPIVLLALLQRNAVLVTKVKQNNDRELLANEVPQEVDPVGVSLEEMAKRLEQEQKKFTAFWDGVKAGVDTKQIKRKGRYHQKHLVSSSDQPEEVRCYLRGCCGDRCLYYYLLSMLFNRIVAGIGSSIQSIH